MAPDSRRRDDGDVSPSPRSVNDEDGAMAPQPFGPMGIAADLFADGFEFGHTSRWSLSVP